MAKAKTMSDELAELGAIKRETWFDRLTKDLQEELLEVRRDFHAGKFQGLSVRRIHEYLSDESRGKRRVTTGRNGFQSWISEGRRGEAK